MATTWTENDLTAIEQAIATGALEVQYADKKVRYRSLDEMMRVRDLIRQSLGQVGKGTKRTYLKHSKGL